MSSEKKRIVHICLTGVYVSGWGYQENLLAKYQKLEGNEVFVLANKYARNDKGQYFRIETDEETDENGVKIIRLNQVGSKQISGPAQIVRYKGIEETLEKIKPDIIFIHNPQLMNVEDIVRFMKRNKDTKLFVDSHSDYSNSARNFISKHILHGILWRYKIRKLVPYAEKFWGVIPARVDFLKERYHIPEEKTGLLLMGMDDELAEAAADERVCRDLRKSLNIEEDDFFIVTGGKIDYAKTQILLLMDAVTKMDNPHVKLLIFGSVADEIKDRFDEKLNASNNIQYIGWITSEETYPYFASADLAVFPGRHSVMWEQAAGQGTPLVCKYWEGTTHVDLGGNVIFLREDSSEEIFTVLNELVENKDKYTELQSRSKSEGRMAFSYREIAKRSIMAE